MTKNSALFAGVTAIIIVALLGSYFYIGDDGDDAREYKVGDVTEFNVFGFAESGDPIRGTFKVVMLDVSDTQYYAEHTSDIYTIDGDGARTPWDVGTYEAWQDKLSSFDHDVKDLVMVDTYWGEKTLQVWESKTGGMYVLTDGTVSYATVYRASHYDYELYYELTSSPLIKEAKADRDIHDKLIFFRGETEHDGYDYDGDLKVDLCNEESAIFTSLSYDITLYCEQEQAYVYSSTVSGWSVPIDDGQSDIRTISTAWGDRETNVSWQDFSYGRETFYFYGDVCVRVDCDYGDFSIQFDAERIMVDGQYMTLDEAVAV